uniref:Uncharacterized protein n=2 Tax=Populus trichocarpa TaxID=3694 RepID=A0A3N7FDD2_POPTR
MQVFKRIGEMSAVVFKQPTSGEERLKALQALLSCPTSSIHTGKPAPDLFKHIRHFLHQLISRKYRLRALSSKALECFQGVHHCGYHSEKSYGVASFLIVRPEGNIIIDRIHRETGA